MSHKTKWLLFHPLSKRQLLPQTLPGFLIENMHVKREHVTKFSGVFIDENLSWKQHINIVSSKISKSIDILYKSKDVLSKQYLQQLYFSFIHNYVNYENIVSASTSMPIFLMNYTSSMFLTVIKTFKFTFTGACPDDICIVYII